MEQEETGMSNFTPPDWNFTTVALMDELAIKKKRLTSELRAIPSYAYSKRLPIFKAIFELEQRFLDLRVRR